MNRLPFEKRRQILHLMVEGNSIRGVARLVDVSPVTVLRYLELAGLACARFHDENVRGVKARRVECDEIWSFNYCKRATLPRAKAAPEGAGDAWTWTALDADSKLIISYLVGGRDAEWAGEFMQDVADRVANRIQLTTDGHRPYLGAVEDAFGAGIDYAMLVKHYGATADAKGPERKYSPGICTGATKRQIEGSPDKRHVSTSYVEKHNQSMRQHMRRFTRLTAAHSKKLVNHIHMVALYTVWYNYARINSAVRMAPAMAAGISDRLWDVADIVKLVEEYEMQNDLSDGAVEALAKVFPLYWELPDGISEQEMKGYARQLGKHVRNGDSQVALEAYLGRIQTNKLGLDLTAGDNRKIIGVALEVARNPKL